MRKADNTGNLFETRVCSNCTAIFPAYYPMYYTVAH